MQWLKDVLEGLRRYPWDAGKAFVTCFSLLFTFVKVSVQFFPRLKIEGGAPLTVGLILSALLGAVLGSETVTDLVQDRKL